MSKNSNNLVASQNSEKAYWGSTRKVRFKSQLYAMVEYVVKNDGQNFSKEEFKRLIQEDRSRREYLRLLIMQRGSRKALRTIGGTGEAYEQGVADAISFAKTVGLLQVNKNIITCPDNIKNMHSQIKDKPWIFDAEILRLLLNSKYKAYINFLKHLQELNGLFCIPKDYKSRSSESGFPEYLNNQGFLTDPASFYTLRDLFYDFGFINWNFNVQENYEQIYLTCYIAKPEETVSSRYSTKIDLGKYSLFYNKKISLKQYEAILSKCYSNLSGGYWGTIIELLKLRDNVCNELRMSDNQFNQLIIELWKKKGSAFSVELSQGLVTYEKSSGFLIKGLNAPTIDNDSYATYIRLFGSN